MNVALACLVSSFSICLVVVQQSRSARPRVLRARLGASRTAWVLRARNALRTRVGVAVTLAPAKQVGISHLLGLV